MIRYITGAVETGPDGGGGGSALPSEDRLTEILRAIILNEKNVGNLIGDAVTAWIVGKFGLKPGSPWYLIVVAIITTIVSQCSNPDKQARAILDEVASRDSQLLPQLPPLKSIALPRGAKIIPASVSTSVALAGEKEPAIQMVPLVIPFDQMVTIKYSVWGHAAICYEQIARAEIFANQKGSLIRPFNKTAHGVSRFPNPETVMIKGEETIQLTAGGYIVRALATGNYSGANITVEYSRVEAPPGLLPSIPKPVLIGAGVVGAGVLGYYLYKSYVEG